MGARFIDAAYATGTGVPPISAFTADPALAFVRGAAVLVNASGLLVECGADPTVIAGFALQANSSAPGYDAANSPTVVTGRVNSVSTALAEATTVFIGRAVNGGTDPVTPTQTLIGESYGIIKTSDGSWAVDIAETTTKTVTIVKIDATLKAVWFKVVAANYQFNLAA